RDRRDGAVALLVRIARGPLAAPRPRRCALRRACVPLAPACTRAGCSTLELLGLVRRGGGLSPGSVVVEQVAGLAVEDPADRIEGREAYGLRPSVLEDGDVRGGNADGVGEVADAHAALGEHAVDRDADCHHTTSSSSARIAMASRRRKRRTRVMLAAAARVRHEIAWRRAMKGQ